MRAKFGDTVFCALKSDKESSFDNIYAKSYRIYMKIKILL